MSALGPCVEWQGRRTKSGYGRAPWGRRRRDGRGRHMVLVHRYVVELIEGRALEAGEVVMHCCDNPPCMRYSHLRRATQADNVRDAEAKGRGRRLHGSSHPNARLSEQEARAIYDAVGSQREVARRYGVSRNLVRLIRTGRAWSHATCPKAEQFRKEKTK